MNITMMACVQLLPQGKENYTQACTKRFQVTVITNDRTLHHYHNRYTNKHQKYQLCFYNVKIQTCYLRYSSASCILHTKLINWNLTLYCLPKLSIQTWILAVLSYCKILCHNQWLLFYKERTQYKHSNTTKEEKWWEIWFTFRCPPDFKVWTVSRSPTSLWAQLSAIKKNPPPTNN